jgi:hypothetical protein
VLGEVRVESDTAALRRPCPWEFRDGAGVAVSASVFAGAELAREAVTHMAFSAFDRFPGSAKCSARPWAVGSSKQLLGVADVA